MKIAIVKLSALGDIIHAMVVLQFVKKYNQAIEVDWIVEESYQELLELNPDIGIVHTVNIKNIKKKKSLSLLYKEFRRFQNFGPYDMVLDMQGLIKSAIISRFIPSKLTLGFDKSSARESLASIFYNKSFKFGYDKNVIERNFELIKFALDLPFKFKEVSYKLPFLHCHQKYTNLHLSKIKKNIILIPGASIPSKRFSVKGFAELTNLLDANYIIVWGNNEENLLAHKIKNLAPHVNICDKLSLSNLVSLITQSDLIIGADTGPTHMGWALNVPSITLFGPTPGYRNTCITKINKIIETNSKVNPFKIDKKDNSLNDLDFKKIVLLSKNLLQKKM